MSKILIFALFMTLNLFHLNIPYAEAKGVSPLTEISMDQAKQIALEKVNGKIIHTKIEEDDGKTQYEIIVQAKDGTYEIEIDKATGKVLEVEKEGANDEDDRHDDDDDDDRYDD